MRRLSSALAILPRPCTWLWPTAFSWQGSQIASGDVLHCGALAGQVGVGSAGMSGVHANTPSRA